MIKAVIFDFDGVLVDSLERMFLAYKEIAKEFGTDMRYIRKKDFLDNDWTVTLKKMGLKKSQYKKAVDIWEKYYYKNHHKDKVFLGVRPVLSALHGKYKLAIASDGYESKIEKKLKSYGLKKYFDVITGRVSKDHKRKPHPMSINNTLKKLKVKPSETVYIGDMDTDIHAAKNAKLKMVIGVTYGFHTRKRLHGANHYADRPKEILNIIERVNLRG
jgi:HAD superfamily hydrolase (TIGR01662 family)